MFKDRLKELRLKKGLTQEALAAHLNLPESTIRRYESSDKNTPRRERLESIADFFNVSVDYLLGRNNDPSTYDIFSSLLNDPQISEDDKELIKKIRELPSDKKRLVKDLLNAFANEINK